MAKRNAKLNTLGQIQADTQDAYLSAPMIAVPSGTIKDLSGAVRQIRDPAQTLRPSIGIERIRINDVKLVEKEKGPASEQIWKLDNDDERVRFCGTWLNIHDVAGAYVNSQLIGDFVEITFYGTGLNVLAFVSATARDLRASVDGGSEGANILGTGTAASNPINNRSYNSNTIFTATSGLALGTHTVKIRTAAIANTPVIYGFEILNESTSISIPKGEIVSAGQKEVVGAATSTAYNSGFDGSPALNGRGGHVVVYRQDGRTGKVIQQANGAQANMTSADHTNEEQIQRVHFRDFGVGRSDDFSTLTNVGATDRAFTLDDGTTTLVGEDVATFGSSFNVESFTPSTTADFFNFTFVGTGLDIVTDRTIASTRNIQILIDGVQTFSGLESTVFAQSITSIDKIVSGLPYGTHTFTLISTDAGNGKGISEFIIYGPKKPSIPDGAVEIGEYFLMADYSGAGITGTAITDWRQVAQGTILKAAAREFLYTGANWTMSSVNTQVPYGFEPTALTNNGQPVSYIFWGTGIVIGFDAAGATYDFTVTIDGALNASGVARSNASNLTGGSYRSTSATANQPCRIEFTGLSLGRHTISIQRSAGTGNFNYAAMYVISPVHFPNVRKGSLALAPSASFPKQDEFSNADFSKAKAVLKLAAQDSHIRYSVNISQILRVAAAHYVVYFEKPFKNNHYVIVGSTGDDRDDQNDYDSVIYVKQQNPGWARIYTLNSNDDAFSERTNLMLLFFGELAGEGEDE